MKAMKLEAFKTPYQIADVPDPVPGPGEVLIEVRACAADTFNVKIRDGEVSRAKVPLIPGHEFSGEIAALGSGVEDWSVGQRVVNPFYLGCGICRKCTIGRETICEGGIRYLGVDSPGGFAEYTVVPARALVELPESISFPHGSILANAIGTAYHALSRRMRLKVGERVIITGAGGGVGLHAIQLARLMGAFVMGVDIGKAKLTAMEKYGADVVVDPLGTDFSKIAQEWTRGEGVEGVLELVGTETIATSLKSLGKGGRLVIVGLHTGRDIPVHAGQMVGNEWEILGSRNVTKLELKEVVSLVDEGRIQPVVTEVHPLEELEPILKRIQNREVVGRIALEP
jgi:D-arabinose 1-dehydrogenase-like Zn-dependent alcohol dehydrogenase